VLDALAVNLDGSPAAPDCFSRRRRVLRKALGYAVWISRMDGALHLEDSRRDERAQHDRDRGEGQK
jgi:hypothetical protein